MIVKRIILFTLGLFASCIGVAQAPINKVYTDKTEIRLGEPIQVRIQSEYDPTQFRVKIPTLKDTFSAFEVLNKYADTVEGRNTTQYVHRYTISAYEPGTWYISVQPFEVQALDGSQPYTELYDSIPIVVKTIAVDTTKPFKPIFDIKEAKLPVEIWLLYIVGGLIGILLIAFVIWYFIKQLREKNKKPERKEVEKYISPYEKAIRSIQDASNKKYYATGDAKLHHSILTDTIRTYLEEEFGLDCLEKTSSEIIASIKKHKTLKIFASPLKELFELADMVKFAKSAPAEEEHEASTQKTLEIIESAHAIFLKQQVSETNHKT